MVANAPAPPRMDAPTGIAIIAHTLEQFRRERGELEEFLEATFLALETNGETLARREFALAQREASLDAREQLLAEQQAQADDFEALLHEQRQQLEGCARGVAELRREVADQRTATASAGGDARQSAQVARLTEQRDELGRQLAACRAELAERADTASQLAQAHAELAQVRGELVTLQQTLLAFQKTAALPDEQQRDALALEHELELVRRRAAEQSEQLAEQKSQLERQQAAWGDELRALRLLLETSSARGTEAVSPPAPASAATGSAGAAPTSVAAPAAGATGATPPAEAAAPRPAPAGPENPVVDSIIEQFSKLQNDVAQRRRRRGR